MNKVIKVLTLNALVLGGIVLTSCGGNSKAETKVEVVTNFTVNPETGEFSFTGVSEAKTYYVRVYNRHEYKTDDQGKQVEIPLEDKVPVAARRIRFKADVTEYSGELDFTNLTAGNEYDAYAYTYKRDNAGDLVFAYTEPNAFTYRKAYPTPEFHYTKTSSSSKGGSSVEEVYLIDVDVLPGELDIELGDNFWGFCDDYTRYDPNVSITLYNLANEKVANKVLTANDITTETIEEEDSKGNKTTKTVKSATAKFNGNYGLDDTKISIKVIATNTTAYRDSEESEIVLLKNTIDQGEPGGGGEGEGSKTDEGGGGEGSKSDEGMPA